MPWDVRYLPDEKVISISGTGPITAQDALRQAEEAVRISRETHATQALINFYDAMTEVSIIDIHGLPEFYKKIGMPIHARIAIVQPKGRHRSESYRFFETVCRNNGFNVKVCDTVPEARAWLKGQGARPGVEPGTPETG